MTNIPVCQQCSAPLSPNERRCQRCGFSVSVPVPLGSFVARTAAGLFDLTLWILSTFALLKAGCSWFSPLIAWIGLVEIGYHLRGSLGKVLFGLSIVVSGRAQFYLRETIGKLASVATFGIGFLVVMGNERMAFHDYIAKTRVVQLRLQPANIRVLAAFGLFLGVGLAAYVGTHFAISGRAVQPATTEPNISSIVQQTPGVCTLNIYDRQGNPTGQGSCFILGRDGLATTNFHVLEEAYRAEATLGDGRLFHVLRIQGFDQEQDLIVFQLGREIGALVEWPKDLFALTLGASTTVSIGDRIATIGSPEGIPNTVSDGISSAIRKDEVPPIMQITAPISSGSSGSPVFDLHGRVIGIVSSQVRDGQNLNFAIPVEKLAGLLDRRDNLTLADFRNQLQPPRTNPLTSDPFELAFERGGKLYEAGRYREALDQFLKVQALRPDEAAAYYNAARCYEHLNLEDDAAVEYYVFLSLAPSNDPDRQAVVDWMTNRNYDLPATP